MYRRGTDGAPEFVEVPTPTDAALQTVLHKINTRTMGLPTRRGVLVEEEGSTYMAANEGDSDEARTLRPLQAAACTYRIAFGPRAGQKVLTVQGAMPREKDFKQTLGADIDGFSLHAAVRCGADDRQALEQLCRYITRPALANERVKTNAAGQVVLRLKSPWRDGTTHMVMSPLEFMQRLAALVPRPRLNLTRFHGVLAPNAKLRAQVVPQEPEAPAQEAKRAECEAGCAQHRPVRLSWAKLLKRVFDLNLEHCPNCGGGAEDHCGDPGTASHREDPHAPGIAGACTASGAGPWPSAASGLTLPNHDSSGDPATWAAGGRLRPRVRGTDGSGLETRDNPPQAPGA